MVDLSRNPTPRECNELLKRGRRDAENDKAAKGGFMSPFATELARAYEAACADVYTRFEQAVAACSSRLEAARTGLNEARKALEGDRGRPASPPVEDGVADYQAAFRAEMRRESASKEKARSTAEVGSASFQAQIDRAAAASELHRVKQCAVSWLQPYAEGVFYVDPSLVERLRPFGVPSMIPADGLETIDRIADRHQSLFGGGMRVPAIEDAEPQEVLGEGAAAIEIQRTTTREREMMQHA